MDSPKVFRVKLTVRLNAWRPDWQSLSNTEIGTWLRSQKIRTYRGKMFDADGVRHFKRALARDWVIARPKVVSAAFDDIQRRIGKVTDPLDWKQLDTDYRAIQAEARVLNRSGAAEVERRLRRYFEY